jgi:hypothetical protein
MPKAILRFVLGSVLLIAAQACVPGQPTPDMNIINTAIAQTLTAVAPTSEPATPVTVEVSPTLTGTAPAPTSTETLSPVPDFTLTPIFTLTPALSPGAPQITVSVPTNCRLGPGPGYGRVGILNVNEVSEVLGRNAAGTWWLIRNPDRSNQVCWLWGRYATVTGDTGGLPVPTSPPLPTPDAGFDVFSEGLDSCTNIGWWLDINIENLGQTTFRSISITVHDLDTDVSRSRNTNGFTDRDGCSGSETFDSLPPETDRVVSSPAFDYNPTGNRLRATITLCSNTGQSGTCVTDTVNFRP